MDKESYNSLMKSQYAWEEFKKNEFESIDKMFLSKQGSMYFNVIEGLKVDIVRQRALKLKEYSNTIDD